MQNRESAHQSLTTLAVFLCLVFVPLFPLSTEEKTNSHPETEERTPVKTEIDSSLEETAKDFNTDIQLPPLFKPNRFEKTAYATSLVILAALNIADTVTTIQALKYEGLTERNPVMKPFRRLIPPMSGLDLSPMFAFFVLMFIKLAVINSLVFYAKNLAISNANYLS